MHTINIWILAWQKSTRECSCPAWASEVWPARQGIRLNTVACWGRGGGVRISDQSTLLCITGKQNRTSDTGPTPASEGACSRLSFIANGCPWMRSHPSGPPASPFTLLPAATNTRTLVGPPRSLCCVWACWLSCLPSLALASPPSCCFFSAASAGSFSLHPFKMDVPGGPFPVLFCFSPWFPQHWAS